ncbi:MAG: hypothetical protein QXK06_00010 [Candidatus Diapherotrites archaeon]
MKTKKSEKGMFWPFRLLIAVIIAFATLIIILSTINYFHQYRLKVSWQRFLNAFEDAYNAPSTPSQPDKGIKIEKDLVFGTTTISSITLAQQFNMPEECITFQAPGYSQIEILNSGKTAKISREINSAVYFQCIVDETDTACKTRCYISFSLPPEIP